ncbi:MAG: hypothetical protein LBV12_11985 [Puniceicoccales bacterium]|jgi:hypothetical protein|nr:hypothetical protein [Puniceicoccales bacterium]
MNWDILLSSAIVTIATLIGLLMFFDIPRQLQHRMDKIDHRDATSPNQADLENNP